MRDVPAVRPARRARRAGPGLVVMGVLVGVLGGLFGGLFGGTTPAAGGTAPSVDARPGDGTVTVSRIDVSHPGSVGAVLTPPAGAPEVTAVRQVAPAGRDEGPVATRRLSPQDLEVVLVPDSDTDAASLARQRSALVQLVVLMPGQARTALGGGTELTQDPARTVMALFRLTPHRGAASPGERLEAALARFSGGPAVRRTVVLVTTHARPEPPGLLEHARARMLASGTQLFVVDLAASPSPLGALAADTGGRVLRAGTSDRAAVLDVAARTVVGALDRQVFVRFPYSGPLPGRVELEVRAGTRTYPMVVTLPATNPQAPPAWVVPPVPAPPALSQVPAWELVLLALAALLVMSSLVYGAWMLAASRREPRRPTGHPLDLPRAWARAAADGSDSRLFFVFLLPCLNEEGVIGASVERLLSIPGDNYAVMVVDDGSDDGTAAVVATMAGQRVWLLRRSWPQARQGKGEALNAAVAELVGTGVLAGRDLDDVIVVVVDADGRLDPHAVAAVTPAFDDPTVGAVQIGVRINNRFSSRLARMQDMEFVIYTHVFQRGRRHLGSVGMGGNGQFMRLSALLTLGPAPWSRSLTEDLDLGVRLIGRGWRTDFCSAVAVHQQGVVGVGKLVRQRTRWFQGHLQSWRLVPTILASAPSPARADLLYHLSSPALLLIASLLTASFAVSLVGSAALALAGVNPLTPWLLSAYLLAFGPSCAYGWVYWQAERAQGTSFVRVLGWSHLYVIYGLMWYAAGWKAVLRVLRRQSGWAKTERTAEPAPAGPPLAAVAAGRAPDGDSPGAGVP